MLEIRSILVVVVLHDLFEIEYLSQLLLLLLWRQVGLEILLPQLLSDLAPLIVLELHIGIHHVLQQSADLLIARGDAIRQKQVFLTLHPSLQAFVSIDNHHVVASLHELRSLVVLVVLHQNLG